MYPNLLLVVFSKICEKYHQYLRLTNSRWKAISKKSIIPNIDSHHELENLVLEERLIHIGNILKYFQYFKKGKRIPTICKILYEKSCFVGNKILVKNMMDRNFHLETTTRSWGMSPERYCVVFEGFYGACRAGHFFLATLMFRYILNIGNARWHSDFKSLGLFYACYGGNIEIIKFLIKNDFDEWDEGLKGACHGGQQEIAELMIKLGANNFNHALQNACEGGNMEIVKLMIEKGANNWRRGFIGACCGEHLEIIDLIIEKASPRNRINIAEFLDCDYSLAVKTHLQKYLST